MPRSTVATAVRLPSVATRASRVGARRPPAGGDPHLAGLLAKLAALDAKD